MLIPKQDFSIYIVFLCFVFEVFIAGPLIAQQKSAIVAKLDSIEAILEEGNLSRDTRLEHLLSLSSSYWKLDPEKSQIFAERAVRIAKQQGNYESEIFALRNLATSYWIRGQQELATPYALQALELSQQHDFKDGVLSSYIMLGLIADETRQLQQSITYYQNALNIAISENSLNRISTIHNNMAAVFYKQEKYADALHHFQEALRIRKQLNLIDGIAEAEGNIAQVYMVSGRYQEAREILVRVLQSAIERDDKNSIIIATEEIGVTHLREGDLELADDYLQRALALAKEMGTIKWQKEIYGYLVEIESLRNNPEKTLAYFKMYDVLKDSLYNVAKVAQVTELQTRYDTEKKEQELSALRERQRIERLLFIAAVVAGLLLLGLLAALFRFRTLRNRQQLRAREAEAENLAEIDRLKSRFFANISHEFRTPLTLIQGPVDLLLQSQESEQTQRQLQLIQTNTNRLLRLINQLLELSRIESGKMELKASLQDIVPYIRHHVMSFHSLAKQRKIELTFHSAEPMIGLFFDQEKLEHIIVNLVSNAIKFTLENGSVSINLKRVQLEEGPYLEMAVKDSGIGIARDYQEHIFERFFQVDAGKTRQFQGTGIGLALTKELVELHKGKVEVVSQPEVGSTFKVYLPFGKDHLTDDQIVMIQSTLESKSTHPYTDTALSEERALPVDLNKPQLLVVEDNPDLQQFIREILEENFTVHSALDGEEGFTNAVELTPDIIISDIMMPGMNGFELTQKLKVDERTSHIPIILLTARSDEEDKITGLEMQADDYLTKPFNTRELLARINNLIESRKKLQEKYQINAKLSPKKVKVSSIEEVFLGKLTSFLEEHIEDEELSIEKLSRELGLSRSQLHRKLNALTGNSPSEFVRNFRLQRAFELLMQNAANISEIAFQTGFSSPAYFTRCFKEYYGYAPSAVKSKDLPPS